VSADDGRPIFDGLVEYPLPAKPGVKDYVVYCGDNLAGYGVGAKSFFDKHYPNHVAMTANTLQDVMTALAADVTSNGVTQIRELVLVTHANTLQLFFPVVPAGADVDASYGCVTAWSLARLQGELKTKFASFDQARNAVVPLLLDDSWVTIRGCRIGNSAEALYALYSFFGGRANVYAPTRYLAFGDLPIEPGTRLDSKTAVYTYLVKQHFLSSSEHTPKRQAAIVTDLVDPEFFSETFQLATAQLSGGDPAAAAAYQQLVDELNQYQAGVELTAAFATAGHQLSANPQVIFSRTLPDGSIDPSTAPAVRAFWYVHDTSLSDGTETVDLVYQIRDEIDAGGTSTLAANAQLAVTSAYASVPFQAFFEQPDDDAFNAVVARLAGHADKGQYAGQAYQDAYNAVELMLDNGTWTNDTTDIAAAVNYGLANAGFDPLPDPLPPIQNTNVGEEAWQIQIPATPPLVLAVKIDLDSAPDGSSLHTIVVSLDLDQNGLDQVKKRVLQTRGWVPDTPGTEIAAYLDGFTADQLSSLMDYLRSAYRPAYAYYLDHALAAIERKRDFLTWAGTQPDFDAPSPAHQLLRPNEYHDLGQVAFGFGFNDNWSEVKQQSKYTATVQTDLFFEGSLTDKLQLADTTYTCGVLPPDSRYFSRAELQARESQGHEQYYPVKGKVIYDPPRAPVDQGCIDLQKALQKWKKLRDAGATFQVQQQELSGLVGADGESGWERMKKTLEPADMGFELWDMAFDSKIEYRAFAVHFAEEWCGKNIAAAGVKEWLEHSLGVAGEVLEVMPAIQIPFELWLDVAENEAAGAETYNQIGELVAMRQWLHQLWNLTFQVPFPDELHIDLGDADQATRAWRAEQRVPGSGVTIFLPDIQDGYASAAVTYGRFGPHIVELADKYLDQQISQSGLSPCSITALTKVGLYDQDELRRRTIRRFADLFLDALPPVP
jgi:hypothetical protein